MKQRTRTRRSARQEALRGGGRRQVQDSFGPQAPTSKRYASHSYTRLTSGLS